MNDERRKRGRGTERKIEEGKNEKRSLWEMLRSGGLRGVIDSGCTCYHSLWGE